MSLFIPLLLSAIIYAKETPQHWRDLADRDIDAVLKARRNEGVARNVVLFVGDGMDLNTVTAARIQMHGSAGETGFLAFERFSDIGLLKTYSANKLVPDSSSTGTALFTGVKVNHRTMRLDTSVGYDDCEASLRSGARLTGIVEWAQESGRRTGFVTTTRVTHATPGALYAHAANRDWECEARIKDRRCKDIARQLVEDEPGRDLNVIMGGGRQVMQSHAEGTTADPTDRWACYSTDGRDLVHEWLADKRGRGAAHAYVQNRRELDRITGDEEYVLGIFANSHMYMRNDNGTLNVRDERRAGPEDPPSLAEMTEKALTVLSGGTRGYLLVVEGGLIDYAHHRGRARAALRETAEFSDAVQTALELTDADDTLVVVTSDHAHSLVFAGYPDRGQGVLGVAQNSKWGDRTPYTTLLYGTGGPNNYQYETKDGAVARRDPSKDNTSSFTYSQQTGVVTDETTHGGSDVLVYANGPWAHLFSSVHEQTYVAYAISYAARMGPHQDRPLGATSAAQREVTRRTSRALVVVALLALALPPRGHT